MKKELIYYSILTLIIALLLVFETNLFDEKTKLVSKVIKTDAFEKLNIDLDCDIYVSLGDEQKVVFEGPSKYLDRVETNLEDGILTISCKKPGMITKWFSSDAGDPEAVKVYIKLTHSDQLIMPKRGNVISNETLQLIEKQGSELFSLNVSFKNLLRLLGSQLGQILLH